ncbi:MAG TPA: hypothetical protein VFS00_15090 [Polyangiaceae bacterium]|nr:hypothetical protein [Polyangiaceae bacterium]
MKPTLFFAGLLPLLVLGGTFAACDGGDDDEGVAGTSGASGASGQSGASGKSGASGASGQAGASGGAGQGGGGAAGGGGEGSTCGGIAGLPCGAAFYCDFPLDNCGQGDATGVCKARPQGCLGNYDPVCACGGTVASNECSAFADGKDLASAGGCAAPEGLFACGAKFCQAGSQYCERTASDVGSLPDSYLCRDLPAACGGAGSCACLADAPCASQCAAAGGGVTLTCPGG